MTPNIVVIGTGRMAQVHARGLVAAGARVVAVVGRPERAAELALTYQATALTDLASLKGGAAAGPAWDAAVIASSTPRHADQVATLLPAGKPLFCEKPLCGELEQARQLVASARQAGTRIMMGYHKRHDPRFRQLRDSLRGEELHCIHLINYDPFPPAQQARLQGAATAFGLECGSIFVDFTVHDFDTLRFLTGQEFVVTAVLHHRDEAREEEESVVLLRSRSGGVRAVIENSRNCGYGHDQRVHACGPRGDWQVTNPRPLAESFLVRYGEAYRCQMAHFVAFVRGEAAAEASLEDGLRSLELAQVCDDWPR